GHADNSVRVISSDGAKTLETAHAHCAPVTCLGLSPDSKYLVTGSRDTTILLWRIHTALASHSNVISEPSTGTGTQPSSSSNSSSHLIEKNRRLRIEGPIQVLQGHQSEVRSCCVSSDLGIVVSCSDTSDVL
ncbi:neurobeachin-like protein, partial [Trifolium medium]|nr:neurobeachin-like protein [Trifolium medium]